MSLTVHEEQIKLLELFSSSEYFGKMRDKWEEMILHAESCLETYMTRLAANHRSKPSPEQADVVWGHRVLPNFRYTLDQLNKGFTLLTHGDSDALGYSDNVRSDFKGQLDYQPDWMSEIDQNIYHDNMYRAMTMAHNISITEQASWDRIEPSSHSEELEEFPGLSSLRAYGVNKSIYVRSGSKTLVTGIYVPDIADCCAQFLGTHHQTAPRANMWIGKEDLINPSTGEKYDEQHTYEAVECTWYLIERTNDNGTLYATPIQSARLLRVAAGQSCPQTGFYFSPALPGSRKRFIEGEVMPYFDSTYGQTIWQWDESQ